MEKICTRKIIKLGDSRAITLPVSWLMSAGLGTGDRVDILSTDGVLLVRKASA